MKEEGQLQGTSFPPGTEEFRSIVWKLPISLEQKQEAMGDAIHFLTALHTQYEKDMDREWNTATRRAIKVERADFFSKVDQQMDKYKGHTPFYTILKELRDQLGHV